MYIHVCIYRSSPFNRAVDGLNELVAGVEADGARDYVNTHVSWPRIPIYGIYIYTHRRYI